MRCTGNCNQGRECSCMPVEMFDNKPSMLARRWFWASAIACSLLYGVAYWALS